MDYSAVDDIHRRYIQWILVEVTAQCCGLPKHGSGYYVMNLPSYNQVLLLFFFLIL
jgi:hypothetical protein